jgi:PAP2 superfamily
MHLWQIASLAFFLYISLLAVIRRPAARTIAGVLSGAAIGSLVALFPAVVHQPLWLAVWIWPPLVLLIAYWTSGLLFVEPNPWQENALMRLDDRVSVRRAARHVPRFGVELLEAAYAGVYLLIPIALLLHLNYSAEPDANRFWAVVLMTDFICFGVLPWVQTRPPRALESEEPWTSSLRRFNLRLLGSTSIQVNTFPSGHAAEALISALLVPDAPTAIFVVMFASALAVSAGAVLGRYHFLADIVSGWLVAVMVWMGSG